MQSSPQRVAQLTNTMTLMPLTVRYASMCSYRHAIRQRVASNNRTKMAPSPKRRPFSSDTTTTHSKFDMVFGPANAFQTNQYVIACTETKQSALVDCCPTSRPTLDAFLKWNDDKGYELSAVWLTHAHLDHICGLGLLTTLKDNKYSEIPIHVHSKERDIYNSFADRCRDFGFDVEGGAELMPSDDKLTFLNDQSTTMTLGNLTFDIISTPGHSPGHVGFYLELDDSDTSKLFFGGDFIMQGSIGRTDFPTSNHSDMEASLERFVNTMDEELVIYPGHGQPSTLKREKQINPFLQPKTF